MTWLTFNDGVSYFLGLNDLNYDSFTFFAYIFNKWIISDREVLKIKNNSLNLKFYSIYLISFNYQFWKKLLLLSFEKRISLYKMKNTQKSK